MATGVTSVGGFVCVHAYMPVKRVFSPTDIVVTQNKPQKDGQK